MPETASGLSLLEFCTQNHTGPPRFRCFVAHKERALVYGVLFDVRDGMVFQQHKWTQVNANKALPRVCAEMTYKHKVVDETIFNSFDEIDAHRYHWEFDATDMQQCLDVRHH